MGFQIYGVFRLLLLLMIFVCSTAGATLRENSSSSSKKHSSSSTSATSPQINSNSVLVALLDSHYTELSELVEKALLLQTLEEAVSKHNITIFAPKNEALERDLDPEFKRFLLEPGNLKSLQNLLLFHMIPSRIDSAHWPHHRSSNKSSHHTSLCKDAFDESLRISHRNGDDHISVARIFKPNDIVRPDGIIHGIERVLIPKSVQQDFNSRRSLRAISAVLPEGAPEVDPKLSRARP